MYQSAHIKKYGRKLDNLPKRAKPDFSGIAPKARRLTKKAEPIGSFKKGGPVKKTGLYKLHKGERVLTVKQKNEYMRLKRKHPATKPCGCHK